MSGETCIGWRVPSEEYERFLRYVESERGDRERYAWVFIENAMREYMDADRLRELEQSVDSLIRAGGYTPSETGAEKKSSETLRGEETALVNRRVDTELRERFMAYVKEETDYGTSYGLALGYALREYRQNGREERTIEKYGRVADDLEALLSAADDGTLPKQDREAVEIARSLPDQFTRTDLRKAIIEETGRDTSHIINDRTRRVLERGYAPHPEADSLIIPAEQAQTVRKAAKAHDWADYREERIEAGEWETDTLDREASEEMDALMRGTPEPDGGRAVTDGGREE